jgi:ATP-GRASP peptide maturase of grasp-with-spasm system
MLLERPVLIISSEDDRTTNDVIDWLLSFGVPVIRVNDSSVITIRKIELNNSAENICLEIDYPGFPEKKVHFDLTTVTSVWYRRGRIDLHPQALYREMQAANSAELNFFRYIEKTNLYLENFIYRFLKKEVRSVNSFFDNYKNKLFHLFLAKQSGLNIPKSIITDNTDEIFSFLDKSPTITKAIPPGLLHANAGDYSGYTSELTSDTLPDRNFSYSLLQEKLEKKFELRIFYLEGEFFTAAIFSQADKQTAVDFRRYNRKKPNRCVPYRLPELLKTKLTSFMKACHLASGSIDVVVTKENEYVFLEVNPIGQFRQVSEPCNYYLEKRVAQFLAYGN